MVWIWFWALFWARCLFFLDWSFFSSFVEILTKFKLYNSERIPHIELTDLPPQYLPLKCVLENDLKFLNESIHTHTYIYIYFFFPLQCSTPVTRTSKLSLGRRSNTATWYPSTLQSHQTWRKWKGQVCPQFLCPGVS